MPDETDELPSQPPEPPPGQADDQRLVAALLRGNADALRQLIDRYDRLIRFTIYKSAKRLCERDPTWLDARANEAWTGIVEALRRLGPKGVPTNLAVYFTQIARNKTIDAVRSGEGGQILSLEEPHAAEAASDPADNPASILESMEEIDALRECISRLSTDEQVICAEIGLIVEKRWGEAAGRLGMPESTLRSRWGAILGRLRACLEKKSKKNGLRLAPPDGFIDS